MGPRRALVSSLATETRAQSASEEKPASGQVWGNLILDFPRRDHLLFEVDFEPKVQYSGTDTWRSFDVTALLEHNPKRWINLVGETLVARTKQSNDVDSVEVTPRLGVRIHFLSNLRTLLPEARPLGRVALANLSRVEFRNLWYSDDTPTNHESRFRNRVELNVALNHGELSDEGTLYLKADFEIFIPLSDDVDERFTSKRRTRMGLGYRHDAKWRFEALYIRDGTRDNSGEPFDTSTNTVDLTVKIFL